MPVKDTVSELIDHGTAKPASMLARMRALQTPYPYGLAPLRGDYHHQIERQFRKLHRRIDKIHLHLRDHQQLRIEWLQDTVKNLVEFTILYPDTLCYLARRLPHKHPVWHYSIRVAIWAVLIGRHMQLNSQTLNDLFLSGLICKVGHLSLPRLLIETQGTRMPQEEEMFKVTLVKSTRLIQQSSGFTANLVKAVSYHLERADGTGYPRRVTSRYIPTLAQILGLADYYESLTSFDYRDEPYASLDAIRELYRIRDRLFDQNLIDSLLQVLGPYPTGSIVKLSDLRIAIVVEQNPSSRMFPKVLPCTAPLPRHAPLWETTLNLAACGGEPRIVASLPPIPAKHLPAQLRFFERAAS